MATGVSRRLVRAALAVAVLVMVGAVTGSDPLGPDQSLRGTGENVESHEEPSGSESSDSDWGLSDSEDGSSDDSSDESSDSDQESCDGLSTPADPVLYRVVASGDLHGDYKAAGLVLEHSKLFTKGPDGEFLWSGGDQDRMVFTGDYVDRGMYSLQVIRMLQAAEASANGGSSTPKMHMLLGNHEMGNLMNTDVYSQQMGGWMHPLELLNYVGAAECLEGKPVATGVRLERERVVREMWRRYESCLVELNRFMPTEPGDVAPIMTSMKFDKPLNIREFANTPVQEECPPYVHLSEEDKTIYDDVLWVYKWNWGTECGLGRYLRDHKVVAKVYDSLYMHAGLNGETLGAAGGSVDSLNKIFRKYMYGGPEVESLTGSNGPIWWRPLGELLKKNSGTWTRIKEALRQTDTVRMVVGHDIRSYDTYVAFTTYDLTGVLDKTDRDSIVGIDVAQSRWIKRYGNLFAPPTIPGNPQPHVSMLLSLYHKSGRVSLCQRTVHDDRVSEVVLGEIPPPPAAEVAVETPVEPPAPAPALTTSELRHRHVPPHAEPEAEPPRPEHGDQRAPRAPVPAMADEYGVLDEMRASKGECGLLQALYASADGQQWAQKWPADLDGNCCSWPGVVCNDHSQVVMIILNSNQLTGTIPMELGGLMDLEYLSLSDNKLTGPFPSSVCRLPRLKHIDVSDNDLHGALPRCLQVMPTLQYLDVADNDFGGPVPTQLAYRASKGDFVLEMRGNRFQQKRKID